MPHGLGFVDGDDDFCLHLQNKTGLGVDAKSPTIYTQTCVTRITREWEKREETRSHVEDRQRESGRMDMTEET